MTDEDVKDLIERMTELMKIYVNQAQKNTANRINQELQAHFVNMSANSFQSIKKVIDQIITEAEGEG